MIKHIDHVDVLERFRGRAITSIADDGSTEIFYDDHVIVGELDADRTHRRGRKRAAKGTQSTDQGSSPGDIHVA